MKKIIAVMMILAMMISACAGAETEDEDVAPVRGMDDIYGVLPGLDESAMASMEVWDACSGLWLLCSAGSEDVRYVVLTWNGFLIGGTGSGETIRGEWRMPDDNTLRLTDYDTSETIVFTRGAGNLFVCEHDGQQIEMTQEISRFPEPMAMMCGEWEINERKWTIREDGTVTVVIPGRTHFPVDGTWFALADDTAVFKTYEEITVLTMEGTDCMRTEPDIWGQVYEMIRLSDTAAAREQLMPVGRWISYALDMGDAVQKIAPGNAASFELHEDGSCTAKVAGEAFEGSWEVHDRTVTLTMQDSSLIFAEDGFRLVSEDVNGMRIILVPSDAMAFIGSWRIDTLPTVPCRELSYDGKIYVESDGVNEVIGEWKPLSDTEAAIMDGGTDVIMTLNGTQLTGDYSGMELTMTGVEDD